jgi:hypothetical protein
MELPANVQNVELFGKMMTCLIQNFFDFQAGINELRAQFRSLQAPLDEFE